MQQRQITEWEAYQALRGVRTDEHRLPSREAQASVDISALLRRMNSFSRLTREQAVREANMLPSAPLLMLVQEGAGFYRQRKRRSTFIELVALLTWLPLCLTLMAVCNLTFTTGLISFLPLVASVLIGHFIYVPFRLSASLVTLLKETDDLKLLGPAISMYVRPDDYFVIQEPLNKPLCRLLAHLRADQSGLLTGEQKRDLLLLVADSQTPKEVRINGLKALEQVGDESAYETVRNISLAAADAQLQQAVIHCLEYLKVHASERREMQTLLRASDSSAASAPDVLLRPAESHANTPPEHLLRPQA